MKRFARVELGILVIVAPLLLILGKDFVKTPVQGLEALLTGLTQGGLYALIALAFSIIYMTTRTINFAQGDVLMGGAYTYFFAKVGLHLPWMLALVVAIVGAAVLSLVVQFVGIRLLGQFDPNTNIGWILTTLSLSLIFVEVARNVFGEQAKTIAPVIGGKAIFAIEPKQYLVLAVGAVLAFVLEIVHSKTQLGRALRATAHDKATASLMGINTTAMVIYSFALAGVLAGIGGWLLGPIVFISPNMGTLVGLTAFIAAVVGGIGSTRGALVGGLFIGIVEKLGTFIGAGEWTTAIVFSSLIIILVAKPTGLLGEALIEKV
ncbi:MAG: branched-chain amino acid ABC transporter permease [Actinomycetota bacterium]